MPAPQQWTAHVRIVSNFKLIENILLTDETNTVEAIFQTSLSGIDMNVVFYAAEHEWAS